MAAPSFALTKIQPPRPRASLIGRERLEARMVEAALAKRLVLLCAPAGFGKTAALTRLIGRLGPAAAVAWIAVDAEDDPLGLLACLCAALEPFDPPWRTDPEALIAMAGGSRSDRRTVVGELLNALAACEVGRGLIVVDDAHRIGDPAVFEFLEQILERLPAHWGVVLSTRVEPPLPLARLRAGDELAEFRESDLRFALAEVHTMLAGLPAEIDAAAASERLLQRTQGWAAGLRLAVNHLGTGHGTASAIAHGAADRHVFDYLLVEVLDELPPELRRFLLRSSVLAELTAGRAAAVTGDAGAARWLEEIERRGLFVSVLEGPEPTLRLHDLFRDFLEDRLRRESAVELPELYRRAAAGEGDVQRRVTYLLRAGDWAAAESLLAGIAADIITRLGPAPVLRLLDQFPLEFQHGSGSLALARCWCAWARWDWPRMAEWAARARLAFDRAGATQAGWRAAIYECVAAESVAAREAALQRVASVPPASLAAGDRALVGMVHILGDLDGGQVDSLAGLFDRVLDALEGSGDAVLWYQCVPRLLQCGLPGMSRPLARFAAGALRAAPEQPTPLRAIAHAARAWVEFFAGRLDTAREALALAEADARWVGPPANVRLFVGATGSMLHALRGRADEAYRAVDEMLRSFDDPEIGYRKGSLFHGYGRLHQLRIADILDDAATSRRLALDLPGEPVGTDHGHAAILDAQRHAVAGRVALLAGDRDAAIAAFRAALADAASLGVFGQTSEIRLRLARLLLASRRIDEGAAEVRAVLRAAEADGEPGGALAAGAPVLGELAAADWQGRLDADDLALLRRWASLLPGPAQRRAADTPRAPAAASIDALSPRELEVLERIAAGDSNKLIARAFELSPHTVKRHVANILDKLALQSRGQAAAWFRANAS